MGRQGIAVVCHGNRMAPVALPRTVVIVSCAGRINIEGYRVTLPWIVAWLIGIAMGACSVAMACGSAIAIKWCILWHATKQLAVKHDGITFQYHTMAPPGHCYEAP